MLAVLVEIDEQAPCPPLGREQPVLTEALVERRVLWDEHERELEAAGLDHLEEVIDARRDRALLPACDHRALGSGPARQLGLRQAGPEAGLPNQICATHGQESTPRVQSL